MRTQEYSTPKKRVIIVGGGYGGLEALRTLGGRDGVEITLLDRNSDFIFQPLLFQVATGRLKKEDICSPIAERVAAHDNARFIQTGLREIDKTKKKVILEDGGVLAYDYLIVATGAQTSYFGNNRWADLTVGLKTPEDAVKMRTRVADAFAAAAREGDPAKRRALLTFVIVGGGPTGVEIAGELPLVVKEFARKFPNIDLSEVQMILLEGAKRLLGTYTEKNGQYAERALRKSGVSVQTGSIVTDVQPGRVVIGPRVIETWNVFWAAGVEASPIAKALGGELDRAGRVIVGSDLTLPGRPNIFVVGDLAAAESNGTPVPGVAQGAIQGGRFAAQAILGDLAGRGRGKFEYSNRGEMAYVGRGDAVVETPVMHMTGAVAWAAWIALHVAIIPDKLQTRASVLLANLAGSYRYLRAW